MLSGDEVDLYTRKYSDIIEHQLQIKGSVLDEVVTIEAGEMGERRYFNRYGSIDNVVQHTTRFEDITLNEMTNERRFVTPTIISEAVGIDKFDLVRMNINPTAATVQSLVWSMGRARSLLILQAMGGTANREIDGSLSPIAFLDATQTIAANSSAANALCSGTVTGATAFTEGKLSLALQILLGNEVDVTTDEVFVVASSIQLTALKGRLQNIGVLRTDFLNRQGLNFRGADMALEGFMGCHFLHYEELADPTQLSGGDEYVYILPKIAVRLGVWEPLRVDVREMHNKVGYPIRVYAQETIGAVRMDELKIVRALCVTTA